MKNGLSFIALLLIQITALATVKLPQVFSDNMVLQRNAPVNVWGWADAGEKITVRFHKQGKSTKADKEGNWKIILDPETAGGPFELEVSGRNTILFKGVLVGEVWICSGQSNMEFALRAAMNAKDEIKAANYPEIRELRVAKNTSFVPLKDITAASWKICSPDTAGSFSAVAFFFARKLQETLKVPVGLIHTSWGGSNVETWTSQEALAAHPDFKDMLDPGPSDFPDIKRRKRESMLSTINAFEQGDMKADDTGNWKNANYNDSRWSTIKAPGFWEGQGLPDLDGIVWYRKEIVLTEEQAAKGGVIELAMIDDSDESYVNGVKVGETHDNYLALRKYPIPPGVLKAGKNVIAIKVTDTGVGGGIHGEAANMQFTAGTGFSQSLAGDWKIKVDTASIQYASTSGPNAYPSLLYNAMIAPVIPYTIKGAIWYQGEANADRAYQYRTTFPLMIRDWRARWKEGDFPFYFVQLSSWDASKQNGLKGSQWAELREAQLKTLSLPNAGMAVTIDIGDAKDIHPTNKQDVGLRLALNALNKTYGVDLVPNGPVYRSLVVKGKEAILYFTDKGSGLMAKDKYGYLKGFTIAGSDQQFKWAKAVISGDTVIVYSDDVNEPVAVRYGWADDAGDANLYNKEGLPASPFRTDNWQGLTESKKYTVVK